MMTKEEREEIRAVLEAKGRHAIDQKDIESLLDSLDEMDAALKAEREETIYLRGLLRDAREYVPAIGMRDRIDYALAEARRGK